MLTPLKAQLPVQVREGTKQGGRAEREAVAWYRKAAEQGQAYAKERLAKLR